MGNSKVGIPNHLVTDETPQRGRTLTLYRDDSTAQVRYDRVKSYFFTANNTVLTISRYDAEEGDGHHYIHWPRERFCWFKDMPL
jgi:hypothetical protein